MEPPAVVVAVAAGLITTLLFALVVFTAYLMIVRRRYAHIPSPKGATFYLGHLSEVSRRNNNGQHLFDVLLQWYNDVGPVFVWWIIHYPLVVVTDSECLKTLMSRKVAKPSIQGLQYIAGQRFAINSIVIIPTYEKWKERRRAFDAAFTRNYLRSLVCQFNSVAKECLIHDIKQKVYEKGTVDMKAEFSSASLHTISRVAFGCNFSKDQFVQSVTGEAGLSGLVTCMLEGADVMIKNPLMQYYRPFTRRKYAEAIRKIREIGKYCIQQRLKQLQNAEQVPQDILSQILKVTQLEKNIDMEDLVDEFLVFYLAGQETTSTLLSFTIILLLQNPDMLQRVNEEIQEVMGVKETVEADDLDKLIYMHQVLEETLRLYPIASAIAREAPENFDMCGYAIPKGSVILISSYVMHHRADVFDEPSVYNPDRFAPDQKRPSPYSYFPFGVGHRSCIGRVFAIMEAKVMLVHLLKTFTLSLPDDYQLKVTQYIELIQPDGAIPCSAVLRS